MDLRKTLAGISKEDRDKLKRKARSAIQLCLEDYVLLNVLEEDTVKKLWVMFGKFVPAKIFG